MLVCYVAPTQSLLKIHFNLLSTPDRRASGAAVNTLPGTDAHNPQQSPRLEADARLLLIHTW